MVTDEKKILNESIVGQEAVDNGKSDGETKQAPSISKENETPIAPELILAKANGYDLGKTA